MKLADVAKAAFNIAKADPWEAVAEIVAVLVVILAVVLVANHFLGAPQRAATAKATAHATQVTGQAFEGAVAGSLGVQDKARARDEATTRRQEENAHALDQSTDTPIPDADADRWRAGLCLYDSAAGDPACNRLPQAGSR